MKPDCTWWLISAVIGTISHLITGKPLSLIVSISSLIIYIVLRFTIHEIETEETERETEKKEKNIRDTAELLRKQHLYLLGQENQKTKTD